jgi:hypothetical protein
MKGLKTLDEEKDKYEYNSDENLLAAQMPFEDINDEVLTVAQKRKYTVLDVKAAKQISLLWLQNMQLENAISFGLPEVDDRYHIWRVPLLSKATKERIVQVGQPFIRAFMKT